jgi:hypothetical protein
LENVVLAIAIVLLTSSDVAIVWLEGGPSPSLFGSQYFMRSISALGFEVKFVAADDGS